MNIILAAAMLAQAGGGVGSQASPAKAPAGAPAQPENKWIAHTSEDRCWLIRGAEEPKGAVFAIHRIPGNETTQIWFVNPEWRRSPIYLPRKVQVALSAGAPIQTEVYFTKPQGFVHGPLEQARIGFDIDDPAALERLAVAGELRVSESGRQLSRTLLPAMRKALSALAACETEALQSWGIDAAVWRRLRSTPKPITKWSEVLKDVEYPSSALDKNAQGNVLLRLTVDASGVPIECHQILGTGNRKLDEQSCSALRQKARFQPALDNEGNPVAAPYVTMVRWRIWRG